MSELKTLRVAVNRTPLTAALLDGVIPPPEGYRLEAVEVTPINRAFRRTIRDTEFDISEMAIGTHYLATGRGYGYVGLPVFLAKHFPHPYVELAKRIGDLSELRGGVFASRSFTMTTGIWARAVLARQYDVSWTESKWVVADEEHVDGLVLPANVERRPGLDLAEMFREGGVDLGVTLRVGTKARPLADDLKAAEQHWLDQTGAEPLNHMLVIASEVVDADPGIGRAVYRWFAESARVGQLPAQMHGLTSAARRSLELLLDLVRDELPEEKDLPTKVDECFLTL